MKIALLIPTLNAGHDWVKMLESVNKQSVAFHRKMIVDSGSMDKTSDLARLYGFDVNAINKSEFNHGKTRQQLVDAAADTDICIFLTQDAILASPDSIANLVSAFDDPEVGMAYGRQLPHKNAGALETHARVFNYPAVPEKVSLADVQARGFKTFFCSNSFSAYRKSALEAVGGFPSDSIMGEDAIVAAKMLMAGYKKAYVADATVYHSHSYTLTEEFKRYFDTRVFHEQNKWMIDKFGKPTGEGLKFIKSELQYVIKNDFISILKSITSIGAKWMGYKSGKYFKKLPIGILRKISMHKFYWK
ncbi:glycosyltransferase family 2 protein [Mucilaginibacter sp.]|uniref:glycosyltransferase n=1 Tax=Mucilaginibacter sp. TaxID=1882438 RepID=UPI002845AEBD|nr:glycosyltransferase family 2 protein [Mucilaginibacter sp.]MDR3694924.1 glycosyltransferase family 2 protein [Mucilaginibacter sp.]